MKVEPIKLDNGGYAVNINAILDGGKNVTPECRVVIKSMDTKKFYTTVDIVIICSIIMSLMMKYILR